MTDPRLEEIRARHNAFQNGELDHRSRDRRELISDVAFLQDHVGYLFDRLDTIAEMAQLWRMQASDGETTDGTEEQLAMADELEAALNG